MIPFQVVKKVYKYFGSFENYRQIGFQMWIRHIFCRVCTLLQVQICVIMIIHTVILLLTCTLSLKMTRCMIVVYFMWGSLWSYTCFSESVMSWHDNCFATFQRFFFTWLFCYISSRVWQCSLCLLFHSANVMQRCAEVYGTTDFGFFISCSCQVMSADVGWKWDSVTQALRRDEKY